MIRTPRAALFLSCAVAMSCAPRLKVDGARMRPIESIAAVTFVANRTVKAPATGNLDAMPTDPTMSTAEQVFALGIPVFMDALQRTERFVFIENEVVLAAESYLAFPVLTGANANTAQLAAGWRYVTPQDDEKIAALLKEIDADAALITYWRFSLDTHTRGPGGEIATPRAHMRAWLVGRDGKIVADDELDVTSDEIIAVYSQRYDGRVLPPLFLDPIETIAVRLVADLSNARAKAREKTGEK